MSGLIDSLLPNVDTILSVRDSIGVVIKPVFFVTRTWSGARMGDGTATDVEVQMLPSPRIIDLSTDLRIREGGAVQSGDIFLDNVSRNLFVESALDGSSSAPNVEKLYRVGANIYQVINVVEKYVTWKIQLRQLSNQTRYV